MRSEDIFPCRVRVLLGVTKTILILTLSRPFPRVDYRIVETRIKKFLKTVLIIKTIELRKKSRLEIRPPDYPHDNQGGGNLQ